MVTETLIFIETSLESDYPYDLKPKFMYYISTIIFPFTQEKKCSLKRMNVILLYTTLPFTAIRYFEPFPQPRVNHSLVPIILHPTRAAKKDHFSENQNEKNKHYSFEDLKLFIMAAYKYNTHTE